MTRALTILNCLGVVALALLCAVQWQRDRRLNLEIAALQKNIEVQTANAMEQSNAWRGATEDLADFKERFRQAHSQRTEAHQSARQLEGEKNLLTVERDQLKASATNWAAAVAERDERLQEMNTHATELALRLKESIARFNELATNYNASVQRFNELATNYNQVVNELNQIRGKPAGKDVTATTN